MATLLIGLINQKIRSCVSTQQLIVLLTPSVPGGFTFNTFTPRLYQAVRAKTAGSHVALHGNFSGPVSTTDLVKRLGKSKKLFGWWVQIFCDAISGGLGSTSLKFLLETRLQFESWYFGWPAGVLGAKVMIQTGVPSLFLAMCPFSIPTDEHVPFQHWDRWICTPSAFPKMNSTPKIYFDKIFGHDYSRIYVTMSM